VTAGLEAFPYSNHNFLISTFVIATTKQPTLSTMPGYSNLVDFALDIVEADDVGISTMSDVSFPNLSNFKRSQSQLLSASRTKQQKKSKSVRFDQYDEVAEIPHINDFSKNRISRLWFSSEEQSETRKGCLELVGRFNSGEVVDKEIMLGLEKQTKAGIAPINKLRQAVNQTIFSLQEFQQRTSAAKPKLIAEFYKKSCAKPALEARLSALKLAVEVKIEIGESHGD
jgi:hypothetical protein